MQQREITIKEGFTTESVDGHTFSKVDKLVVQHAEFCNFVSPCTGLPSSKLGNTYSHTSKKYIKLKWGMNFRSTDENSAHSITKRLFSTSLVPPHDFHAQLYVVL